jgi:hypothetical protein
VVQFKIITVPRTGALPGIFYGCPFTGKQGGDTIF